MKTNPNDPAYPCEIDVFSGNAQFGDITVSKPGLSIRAQFAKDFMSAQVKHYGAATPKSLAKMAVEAADALIEQLNSES